MAFNHARLVLARKRRGMSKAALAKVAKLSVRSLVYYESGEAEPSLDTANVLATALHFPVEFFHADGVEEITSETASFRSLKRMTAAQRDMAIAAGTLAVELSRWIESRFDLPQPDIPSLRGLDPETAAEVVRSEWGLGQKPIHNMVHLAESKGVRVFSLPVESAVIDAFSVWHSDTPFIFLNPMKSGERGRMDVAHELGHLVLHRLESPPNRMAEFEADRFASAFLMPKADVLAHIPRSWSVSLIHKLKARWKVAAFALVVRLWHLQCLTEWQYRSFCIELSEAGFRRSEPGGIPREMSQVLMKVLDALRSDGLSRNALARELKISPRELNLLISGLAISEISTLRDQRGQTAEKHSLRPHLYVVPSRDED